MSVTVRAKLPKGDLNGLTHLEGAMAHNPDEIYLVIGILRADTIENRPHNEDDPRLVKTVLLHIEAVGPQDRAKIDKLVHSIHHARTGKATLPFEDEDGGE